jgi:outer membrane protein assembly complex protein YaeT
MRALAVITPGIRRPQFAGAEAPAYRTLASASFLFVIATVAILVLVPSIAAAAEGPVIVSARVEAIGPVDEEGIIEVLELQPGNRLDGRRLRELILTLYASGEVEWLRVQTAEAEGGVDVVVRLSFRSTISGVKVRTGKPMLRVKVRRWVQIELGDPVTAEGIEASRRRVERRLYDRGFTGAVVEAYLEFDRKTNTVAAEFEINSGPPQVVRSVVLEGLDDEEVMTAAAPKYKAGAKLTSRLEDRLRDRTEANLRTMGFWEAEVLSIERRVDGAEVDLELRVELGSRFRLELEAPPESLKISEDAFPDPAKEEIHPAQTEALTEQIVENLQESGFLLAEVSAELTVATDEQILRVQVDPGRKLKVADVEFPGAENIRRSELRDAIAVKAGGTGGRFKQNISNATLEADRKALVELYQRRGFPFAELSPPELVHVEGEDKVRILFPVDEAVRWLISEVRIEGLPVEAAAELESDPLELAEGSPWSPGAVERAKGRLEDALADSGYPEGRVAAQVDTSQEGSARVYFEVSSGPFVRIGDVIIAGLRRTHMKLVAGVVRRAGVSTGEPLSRRKMLDAQRGLFELGLFRRAELAPMPGQEHRADRNIVVACEEGEQKSYLFGVGYSNVDAARLILGWSHLNLLGRAYAFSAEVSLSRRQQRYSLSLRKQRAFGLPIPGYLAIYRTDEILGDRNVLRRGLWVDFGDRLKRPFRPWLRYEYEITEPEDFPIDVTPDIEDTVRETKVASITPSLEWDTRDNPLAPTRGIFASASLQYAFPAFQADANFLRFQTGGTVYSPIFRGFGAIGLRLGAIKPLKADPNLPENLQIPFAYRFFAGGRTTHRAFATDDLGIPGQTIIDGSPVGGNALILLNLEYRRRISGPLFAAIFVDAGNVWASPEQVNFSDVEWGPGLGLQYVTPAGPLRAEYAWRINAPPDASGGQFFISFGVPF